MISNKHSAQNFGQFRTERDRSAEKMPSLSARGASVKPVGTRCLYCTEQTYSIWHARKDSQRHWNASTENVFLFGVGHGLCIRHLWKTFQLSDLFLCASFYGPVSATFTFYKILFANFCSSLQSCLLFLHTLTHSRTSLIADLLFLVCFATIFVLL